MAAPRKINADELGTLASLQCTQAELAAFFCVSTQAVEAALRKPEFRAAYDNGRHNGLISLRRAQFQKALEGNSTMLIWLGKQLLGQKDSMILGGTGPEGSIDVNVIESARQQLADRIAREAAAQAAGSGDSKPD